MKSIKYIAVLLTIFLLLFIGLVLWEENRTFDTGFIPHYSGDAEIQALFEKARTEGLTTEESERLDWLTLDRKIRVEAQFREYLDLEGKNRRER